MNYEPSEFDVLEGTAQDVNPETHPNNRHWFGTARVYILTDDAPDELKERVQQLAEDEQLHFKPASMPLLRYLQQVHPVTMLGRVSVVRRLAYMVRLRNAEIQVLEAQVAFAETHAMESARSIAEKPQIDEETEKNKLFSETIQAEAETEVDALLEAENSENKS